jgi:hypothetical protein
MFGWATRRVLPAMKFFDFEPLVGFFGGYESCWFQETCSDLVGAKGLEPLTCWL